MEIIKVKNYNEVNLKAYSIIEKLLKEKPYCVLGLATGSTPIGLYKLMIEGYKKGDISFENVKSVNLDEYIALDINHSESYYSFMHTNLFNHININKENINLPNGNANNMQDECIRYSKLVKELKQDIQILGIGENGHIGFNEPYTPFDINTHVVELTQNTRENNARFFNNLDEVPTHAITMGFNEIMQAEKIIIIACGNNKKNAINALVNGKIDEACPASILQKHKNAIVIVDSEAGEFLI